MGVMIEKTTRDFSDYYRKNALQESTKIKSAGNWIAEVLDDDDGIKGHPLPWERTQEHIALDTGQLTIWGGWSGHGKSELLGQVITWLMPKHKCAIASLEMRPSQTLNRMIRQTHGTVNPTDAYKMGWMDWANERLYIYDAIERVTRQSMLGMVLYCKKELGIDHIVIDSLTKCGISKDDMAGQATFVDDLQNMAKATGAHIHLVAHLTKPDRKAGSGYPEPTKDGVRGAGEITDLADNVFLVYRNEFKDHLVAEGQASFIPKGAVEPILTDDMWDTKLKLVKNRESGTLMNYKLWRHPSGQYVEAKGRRMFHKDGQLIDGNVKEYLDRKQD